MSWIQSQGPNKRSHLLYIQSCAHPGHLHNFILHVSHRKTPHTHAHEIHGRSIVICNISNLQRSSSWAKTNREKIDRRKITELSSLSSSRPAKCSFLPRFDMRMSSSIIILTVLTSERLMGYSPPPPPFLNYTLVNMHY